MCFTPASYNYSPPPPPQEGSAEAKSPCQPGNPWQYTPRLKSFFLSRLAYPCRPIFRGSYLHLHPHTIAPSVPAELVKEERIRTENERDVLASHSFFLLCCLLFHSPLPFQTQHAEQLFMCCQGSSCQLQGSSRQVVR